MANRGARRRVPSTERSASRRISYAAARTPNATVFEGMRSPCSIRIFGRVPRRRVGAVDVSNRLLKSTERCSRDRQCSRRGGRRRRGEYSRRGGRGASCLPSGISSTTSSGSNRRPPSTVAPITATRFGCRSRTSDRISRRNAAPPPAEPAAGGSDAESRRAAESRAALLLVPPPPPPTQRALQSALREFADENHWRAASRDMRGAAPAPLPWLGSGVSTLLWKDMPDWMRSASALGPAPPARSTVRRRRCGRGETRRLSATAPAAAARARREQPRPRIVRGMGTRQGLGSKERK